MFSNEENQELVSNNDALLDDNVDDLPPELDEIQDLNNSTTLVAPTKKALDAPHSFFDRSNGVNEDSKNDLLDQYENSEVNVLSQNNNTAFEPSILSSNDNFQLSSNSQNEGFSADTLHSTSPTDSSLETSDILSSNNLSEQTSSKVVDYEYQSSDTNNSILSSIDESEETDVSPNNILNDSSELEQSLETDYEIVNDKKLSDEDEQEVISEVKDESKEDDSDTLVMEDEQSSKLEKIKEESLQKIKDIIKDLNSSGVNIRIEEFDFESIHQMIIIVDK